MLHCITHHQTRCDRVLEWRGRGQQRITLHAVAMTVYLWQDKDQDINIDLVSARLNNSSYITAYL